MACSCSTLLRKKGLLPEPLRGQLALVMRLVFVLQRVVVSSLWQLLTDPVLQSLRVVSTHPLGASQCSELQVSASHVTCWFILPARLLLLLFFLLLLLPSLRQRRTPLSRGAVCSGQGLRLVNAMQQLCRPQHRPVRYTESLEIEHSRFEETVLSSAVASARPQHARRRPQRQLGSGSLAVMLLVCFLSSPCIFPDYVNRLPAAPPLPAARLSTDLVESYTLSRTFQGEARARANRQAQSGVIVFAAAAFRSLIPPVSPGFAVIEGKTRGASQLYADPPTLQLSGSDSLYCSCQEERITNRKLRSDNELRGISNGGVDVGARKRAANNTSMTETTEDNSEIAGWGSGSSNMSQDPHEDGQWCCSTDEKLEALHRVFDAPDGVAFVSLGDSGQPGTQLTNNAATLGDLSRMVNLRYINLLGDNFYPHGVYSTSDPLWDAAFDRPFDHPALEKVTFFPVLGNHDYALNPYAQIERYMQGPAAFTPLMGGPARRRRLGPTGLHARSRQTAAADVYAAATNQGAVGDRWRFPNYWYFTRHVFKDVPHSIVNPYNVGTTIYDVNNPTPLRGEGPTEDVVVVTIYVDTMILLADESRVRSTPYIFPKDEIYYLQMAFIENVLREAQRDADWIFICGHHPVMTDGTLSRNLPGFAAVMKALLAKYHVDVYVSGHEHMLSLFQGEPGTSATFIISGAASKQSFPVTCLRKSCAFNSAKPGFVMHLMSKTELHHIFINNYGKVLFTHTQHVQRRARGAGQISLLAYPQIRRVYIGPADQSMGLRQPHFAPYCYFLFGALTAAACILFVAALVWLLRTFKRRKQAIVSAFRSRLHISQPQPILHDDSKVCRGVLVVSGRVVGPPSPSVSDETSEKAPDEHAPVRAQRPEQQISESAPLPRVSHKTKASLLPGTLRRSSSRLAQMERTDTSASASMESQFLLEVSPPLARYENTWVGRSLPPSNGSAPVEDH